MEININNYPVRLEEFPVEFSFDGKDFELRLFNIPEGGLEIPGILRAVSNFPNEDTFLQFYWSYRFNRAFPMGRYTSSFNLESLNKMEEFDMARSRDPYLKIYRPGDIKSENGTDKFFYPALYKTSFAGFKTDMGVYVGDPQLFRQYIVDKVFNEFRMLDRNTPEEKRKIAFAEFRDNELQENPELFRLAQYATENSYLFFVDKTHKHIYKLVHPELTKHERRAFLLLHTIQHIIPNEIVIIDETRAIQDFIKYFGGGVFHLYFHVWKPNEVAGISRERVFRALNNWFQKFLVIYPVWQLLWPDYEHERYEKKEWPKRHVSMDEKKQNEEGSIVTLGELLPGFDRNTEAEEISADLIQLAHESCLIREGEILQEFRDEVKQKIIAHQNGISQPMVSKIIKEATGKIRDKIESEGRGASNFIYENREELKLWEMISQRFEYDKNIRGKLGYWVGKYYTADKKGKIKKV